MEDWKKFRNKIKDSLVGKTLSEKKEIITRVQGESLEDYERMQHRHIDEKERARYFIPYEKKLLQFAEEAESLDDLKSLVSQEILFIANGYRGIDHSEHLIKRIDMYTLTSNQSLLKILPIQVQKIIQEFGKKEGLSKISYNDFMKNRFPYLSAEDRGILEKKLPLDIFCSIDIPIEDIIVKMNSLPEVITEYSCSGHSDDQFGFNVYIAYKDPKDLLSLIRYEFRNNSRVNVELRKNNERNRIGFYPTISSAWLMEQGLESPAVNFLAFLDQYNKKSGFECFNKTKQWVNSLTGDQKYTLDYILRNAEEYVRLDIHDVVANYFNGDEEKARQIFGDIRKLFKRGDLTKIYEQFYLLDDARMQRDEFLRSFEQMIDRVRDEQKSE
jgi:hypothetical protein